MITLYHESDYFHCEKSFLPSRYVTILFDLVHVTRGHETKYFVQKTKLRKNNYIT